MTLERKSQSSRAKKRRVATVDLDSGEILDGFEAKLTPVKIKHFTQDYMVMFLERFANIAEDKEMSGDATRVLLWIVSKTQMKNWAQLQQKEIAEALGMKQPNVSRAIKKLIDKQLIETTAKLGKGKSYRISLELGWRGPGKSYTDEKHLRIVKRMAE